jgi:hypothetical protein
MRRLRSKAPSPALIVATIALIVALAGTSYAAGFIGTAQLKDKAVTNSKLAPNSVGLAKIRDAAVSQSKIALSTPTASVSVPAFQRSSVTASCPSGTVVLDGGGGFPGATTFFGGILQTSNASGTTGWLIQGINDTNTTQTLVARAVCIKP